MPVIKFIGLLLVNNCNIWLSCSFAHISTEIYYFPTHGLRILQAKSALMPLRVRPWALIFSDRISATSQWRLFIHFSSAQPDNVKQMRVLSFQILRFFQGIKPLHYLLLRKKKSQYRYISITFHINYVPIFSSSPILFPDKRHQNGPKSDKN